MNRVDTNVLEKNQDEYFDFLAHQNHRNFGQQCVLCRLNQQMY